MVRRFDAEDIRKIKHWEVDREERQCSIHATA